MGSLNQVTLLGNLGIDPEVRYTASGQAVANFNIATNESWTDKDGKKQEKVEWHRIVVWGKQAESCGEYLSKGRQVLVEGKLQTRKWQDKEGRDQYTTEIVARQVVFVGNAGAGSRRPEPPPPVDEANPRGRTSPASSSGGPTPEDFGPAPREEEIPF